ncbi:hypothetical protein BX667DRAFT_503580 [Coemansia mojavensis]|nr:hypothetical protein BX667DRAFT_503580 [Coemansia mojavensis]
MVLVAAFVVFGNGHMLANVVGCQDFSLRDARGAAHVGAAAAVAVLRVAGGLGDVVDVGGRGLDDVHGYLGRPVVAAAVVVLVFRTTVVCFVVVGVSAGLEKHHPPLDVGGLGLGLSIGYNHYGCCNKHAQVGNNTSHYL